MNKYVHGRFVLALAASILLPTLCLGVGFRLPNQDPEALSRGNAFAATADNPSAIYYNPAGITQLEGQNLQFGLYSIVVNSRYRSPRGDSAETKLELQNAPQLYYTYAQKDKPYTLGLGMYAPYGLGLQWPGDSGFRTISREARLMYASINPVIAWQVSPTLSLAAGPTINIAQAQLRTGIAVANPNDQFAFRGEGMGLGFNAGLLWRPTEQWALGLNYRGPTEIEFIGRSHARPYLPREKTSGSIEFPQYAVVGLSYRPNKNWNIEADVDYTDWDVFNAVTFRKNSGPSTVEFNFKPSLMYEIGVTRSLDRGYAVSAGYFFAESSTPNRNFNPSVPDTDQHSLSLGLSRSQASWKWAVTYQVLFGPWRTVTGSQSATPESADGKYRFFNNAINISINHRF